MKSSPPILAAAHTISALGEGLDVSLQRMRSAGTALRPSKWPGISVGSIDQLIIPESPQRIQRLIDRCLGKLLNDLSSPIPDQRWACILSTTKGDITALDHGDPTESNLHRLAEHIQRTYHFPDTPWVVSNACASGTSAIALAASLIEMGHIDHAIVIGVDVLSDFVIEGFRCLYALGTGPCRPFDADRDGTSLGEACAAVFITNDRSITSSPLGTLIGHGIAHDANHISGPSRTGEGLVRAIGMAMKNAETIPEDIAVINAHGTGTDYNDAMEAIAFERCGLASIPISTYKGWFGHTLGAAGILECVLAAHALNTGILLRNEGMRSAGFSGRIDVMEEDRTATGAMLLKTSSGFGGCNAALIIKPWRE